MTTACGGQGGKESTGENGRSPRPASPKCAQFSIAIDTKTVCWRSRDACAA